MKFEEAKTTVRKRKILVVEDDDSLNRLIVKTLKRFGYPAYGTTTGSEAMEIVSQQADMVLLLDQKLPDITGREVIETLIGKGYRVPFIVITGQGDERLAVEMMKLGAADYLIKDIEFFNILPRVMERLNYNLDTEQRLREAEEALRESEHKYRRLAENMKDIIWTADLNLNTTYISPSVEWILGYTPAEYILLPFTERQIEEDTQKLMAIFQQELAKENDLTADHNRNVFIEARHRHAKGNYIWVEINATFVRDEDGKAIGIQGTTREITDRKMAEEALRQSKEELQEANAAKVKLFSVIGHDMNNVYSVIRSYVDSLQDHDINLSEVKDLTNILQKAVENQEKLLQNLLEWAKLQTDKITVVPDAENLTGLINMSYQLLKESAIKKDITLDNRVDPNLVVFADFTMIDATLRNLISNAIKFTPRGGKITVTAREVDDSIEIAVNDNGVGMDSAKIQKLFKVGEDKVSTKGTDEELGTGLGLILCREFIDKNGGQIWVESEKGSGSTFYLTLPKFKSEKICHYSGSL